MRGFGRFSQGLIHCAPAKMHIVPAKLVELGGASGANRGYLLAHCGGGRDAQPSPCPPGDQAVPDNLGLRVTHFFFLQNLVHEGQTRRNPTQEIPDCIAHHMSSMAFKNTRKSPEKQIAGRSATLRIAAPFSLHSISGCNCYRVSPCRHGV